MLLNIPYGTSSMQVDIPDKNLLAVVSRKEPQPVADDVTEVTRAIRNPIGCQKLDSLVGKGSKILVITYNWTRAMPNTNLAPVLKELGKAGVRNDDITIISGNGWNRQNTQEERKKLVGDPSILEEYEFVETDIFDKSTLRSNGKKTSHGTEIEMHKLAWDVDLIVTANRVAPHDLLGYGGGRSALLPGIGGDAPLRNNHSLVLQPGSIEGVLEGNPAHEDLVEFVELSGKPMFIVDTVYARGHKVLKTVAGHYLKSWLEGVDLVRKMCTFKMSQIADIAIAGTGGYPGGSNMRHSVGIFGRPRVKDGGVVIAVARCEEGFGELGLYEWMKRFKTIDEAEKELRANFPRSGHNNAILLREAKKHEIILVSDIPDNMVKDAFMTPAHSAQEALEMALNKKGRDAKILAMPYNDCLQEI
jgi:nickel-dependent lactate racemase